MAKTVNRSHSKLREKDDLRIVLGAINVAKKELSALNDRKKEQESIVNNNANVVAEYLEDSNIIDGKINSGLEKLAELDLELHSIDELLRERLDEFSNVKLNVSNAKDELKKLVLSRDSYFSSFENEKEERMAKEINREASSAAEHEKTIANKSAVVSGLIEKEVVYSNYIEELKEIIKNNEAAVDNQLLAEKDRKSLAESEIELIKISIDRNRAENIKEVDNQKLKLESIAQKLEDNKNTLLRSDKVLDEHNLKVETFKNMLELIGIEMTNAKDRGEKEISAIKTKIKIETEELSKIRSQKFGIIKGKKDLEKLHAHIKDLYGKAGITMPKIDLNI